MTSSPTAGAEPAEQTTGRKPAAPTAARKPGWDRSTRRAALVATLVAVPVTVAVAGFTFAKLAPDTPAVAPSPTATSASTVHRPSTSPAMPTQPRAKPWFNPQLMA